MVGRCDGNSGLEGAFEGPSDSAGSAYLADVHGFGNGFADLKAGAGIILAEFHDVATPGRDPSASGGVLADAAVVLLGNVHVPGRLVDPHARGAGHATG